MEVDGGELVGAGDARCAGVSRMAANTLAQAT